MRLSRTMTDIVGAPQNSSRLNAKDHPLTDQFMDIWLRTTVAAVMCARMAMESPGRLELRHRLS